MRNSSVFTDATISISIILCVLGYSVWGAVIGGMLLLLFIGVETLLKIDDSSTFTDIAICVLFLFISAYIVWGIIVGCMLLPFMGVGAFIISVKISIILGCVAGHAFLVLLVLRKGVYTKGTF